MSIYLLNLVIVLKLILGIRCSILWRCPLLKHEDGPVAIAIGTGSATARSFVTVLAIRIVHELIARLVPLIPVPLVDFCLGEAEARSKSFNFLL